MGRGLNKRSGGKCDIDIATGKFGEAAGRVIFSLINDSILAFTFFS